MKRGEPRSFVNGISQIGEQQGGVAALWKDDEIAAKGVAFIDMLATFASFAGQPLGDGGSPDSIDALPALLEGKPGRDHLVEHGHGLALRMGQWKWVPPHPARDGAKKPAL